MMGRTDWLVAMLLLSAVPASAQTLAGMWGSPLYQVQLAVSGTNITGTFTPADTPQAPAGQITGQLQSGGQAFTATWSRAVGPDIVRFQTYLRLAARDSLLTGYRWTEETTPTSFALHRAVNGQVPVLIGQDDSGPTNTTTSSTTTTTTTTTTNNTPVGTPNVQVTTCESVVDGQPQNVGDQFTAPKSIAAVVRFSGLPANSTLEWLWMLGGRQEAKFSKAVEGTGWHMHGLRSETAIIPGAYQLTVSLNGQVVARRTVTVRAPGGSTTTTTTTPSSTPPGLEVTVCESAPGGVAQNPGSVFYRPKSLVCLVKHSNLPDNSELRWVWIRNGAKIADHTKTVSGTGWAYHGLTGMPTMTPGPYKVSVYARGSLVTTVALTVK